MAESGGDVSEQLREAEETMHRGGYDIHVDDTEVVDEEDETNEYKEDVRANFLMRGPTPITELEAGIIQGREHEFVVAPTSSFTNMRILDEEYAIEIYTRLLTKQSVSSLTLRPVSYYDENFGE